LKGRLYSERRKLQNLEPNNFTVLRILLGRQIKEDEMSGISRMHEVIINKRVLGGIIENIETIRKT
jgi:hypothetical protein